MADREMLLSPKDDSAVVELSRSARVYRKRILPKATIRYRGRKITFDTQYLNDLANSFKQGAYDQVPFMLADTNNVHTMDPERMRGEVTDLEVADDGLYAKIRVTPDAVKLLEQNPRLGVSARILEGYKRSDGKFFPRALQHVLGTLDPVIPGLGAWEEVALSNGVDPDNVIDLSAASYEEFEQMADRAALLKQVAEAADMSVEDLEALGMTDDELAIFASAFSDTEGATAEVVLDDDDELIEEPGDGLFDEIVSEDGGEVATELPTEDEIAAAVEALSDEELEELAAELGIEDKPEAADESEAEAEFDDEEPEADTDNEPEAGEEPETAPSLDELSDAELADRLGSGEFGSGIDTPAQDPDFGDMTDEELAELADLWETGRELDAMEAQRQAEAETAGEPSEAETETEETPVLAGAGAVSLSNPVHLPEDASPEVVALSNQVADLQRQLAEQQFEALKKDYVRKGVPAALVDLARPVLVAGPAAVLEFSNSIGGIETVDAADVVRRLLDSATGYIDLAKERGHSYSLDGEDRAALEAEEDKRLASLWGELYGY